MFKYIENTDPMKSKQLEKGLNQLMDEGVAQLFTNQFNGRKIVGTVGQLQFEVIQYRLLHEYGAQCHWEPISLQSMLIESDNDAALRPSKAQIPVYRNRHPRSRRIPRRFKLRTANGPTRLP